MRDVNKVNEKLKAVWYPRIEDDLHSFVVCGVMTRRKADELLKEFKRDGSKK